MGASSRLRESRIWLPLDWQQMWYPILIWLGGFSSPRFQTLGRLEFRGSALHLLKIQSKSSLAGCCLITNPGVDPTHGGQVMSSTRAQLAFE